MTNVRCVFRVKEECKPYSEIPGPRELPLIGNSWRFAPIIGEYYFIHDNSLIVLSNCYKHAYSAKSEIFNCTVIT